MQQRVGLLDNQEIKLDVYYRHNLSVFLSRTNEDQVVVDHLSERLSEVRPNFYAARPWRMLDIGGGSGSKTFELIARLQRTWAFDIELTNVDPCQGWHAEYRLVAESHGLGDVISRIVTSRWEDFQLCETFDFVLCSHSLYGIADWAFHSPARNMLAKIARALEVGGTACIVVQAQQNIVHLVQQEYQSVVGSMHYTASLVCGDAVWSAIRRLTVHAEIIRSAPEWLDVCLLWDAHHSNSDAWCQIMSLMLLLPDQTYALLPGHVRARLEALVTSHSSLSERTFAHACRSKRHRLAPLHDDFIWLLEPMTT